MSKGWCRAYAQVKIWIAADGLQYRAQNSGVVGGHKHCVVIKSSLFKVNTLIARQRVAVGVCATVANHRQSQSGSYVGLANRRHHPERSEEHTSELQSRQYLVCRLLLEKK